MTDDTMRIGYELIPADPFWVQMREAVQQRAQEIGLTLAPVVVPSSFALGAPSVELLDELKFLEIGALDQPREAQITDAGTIE